MTWQHWVIASLFGLNVLIAPVGVNKPRVPRTPERAVIEALFAIAFLMLLVWGQR